MVSIRSALAILGLAAATIAAPAAQAQDYPSRPIQLVVPFSAGGGNDIVARHFADAAARIAGVEFQVVPMPGASGARGTKFVAEAEPDGYTLVFGSLGSAVTGPVLNDVGYEPEDFAPIAIVSAPSFVIAVSKDSPIQTLDELIEQARTGVVTYGSSGAGGSAHVAMELFARAAGVEFRHIPFNGGSEALVSLMGNHTDAAILTTGTSIEQIKAGEIRALAISTDARSPELPDLPTAKEQGVDYTFYSWRAMLGPAAMPQPVQDFLVDLAGRVSSDPAFVEAITNVEGEPPIFIGGADFAERIATDVAQQREIAEMIRN